MTPEYQPTQQTIDLARAQLAAGDRAGAYYTLWLATGNEAMLRQAQVISYSGFWGGGAIAANLGAARSSIGRELYSRITTDEFSAYIVEKTINTLEMHIERFPDRPIANTEFYMSDMAAWNDLGVVSVFPLVGLYALELVTGLSIPDESVVYEYYSREEYLEFRFDWRTFEVTDIPTYIANGITVTVH